MEQRLETDLNPFDIVWLAQHFGLNSKDVIKGQFDNLHMMYEIYFTNLPAAKKFYDDLIKFGCHPQFFKFNLTVGLNKFNKDSILKAAQTFSRNNVVVSNILPGSYNSVLSTYVARSRHPMFSSPLLLEKIASEKTEKTKTELDELLCPFNIKWFAQNLNLNIEDVLKDNFDFTMMHYELTFKTLEAAECYEAILKELGIKGRLFEYTQSLEISYDKKWEILKIAHQTEEVYNPWNINFFVNYFDLNREQVKTCSSDIMFSTLTHFTLQFHDSSDAYTYYKQMTSKGIYPKDPRSSGELTFTNMNNSLLIKKAAEVIKSKPQETKSIKKHTGVLSSNLRNF